MKIIENNVKYLGLKHPLDDELIIDIALAFSKEIADEYIGKGYVKISKERFEKEKDGDMPFTYNHKEGEKVKSFLEHNQ
ncbi:MAG: hypothetical protein ABIB47_00265 [Candidatus Woesearchaeota archaeon]